MIVVVALLLASACFGSAAAPAANAVVGECASSDSDNALLITQTSTITGLAPRGKPVAITGRLTNAGGDETSIADVVVSIRAVTKAAGAAAGACGARDYVLRATRMAVARTLPGRGSTTFGGASIRFRDRTVNQDACKGAAVTLLFTVD